MTIAEPLEQLDARLPGQILDGSPAETLAKARAARLRHPLVGRVPATLYDNSGVAGLESAVARSQAARALGALRLEFMKDDAPVEGSRLVESVVLAIDGADNDEALTQEREGKP